MKIDDFKCVGNGTSKKEAKRRASEEMLKLLGLDPGTPSPSPATPDTVRRKTRLVYGFYFLFGIGVESLFFHRWKLLIFRMRLLQRRRL